MKQTITKLTRKQIIKILKSTNIPAPKKVSKVKYVIKMVLIWVRLYKELRKVKITATAK